MSADIRADHLSLPSPLELEVSLFGPGYGEALAIHVCDGRWILVDSCIDEATGRPAHLAYLQNIGVNVARSVELVVSTHWHDDHVRGLSEVVRECANAGFACSIAMNNEEFLTMVRLSEIPRMMLSASGADEIRQVFEILNARRVAGADPIRFALANVPLWRGTSVAAGSACTVTALSPSNSSVWIAISEWAALIPIPGPTAGKGRIMPRKPNHNAVVLSISVGSDGILLGSDLEETANPHTGWSAILNSPIHVPSQAAVFKIAHHGSVTGHHPSVWDSMLMRSPCAVLTPYVNGRTRLPNSSDIERILGYTARAFSTAKLTKPKSKGRSRAVEKTIRDTVGEIRSVPLSTGHIRIRKDTAQSEDGWRVDLFGDALQLAQLYAQ